MAHARCFRHAWCGAKNKKVLHIACSTIRSACAARPAAVLPGAAAGACQVHAWAAQKHSDSVWSNRRVAGSDANRRRKAAAAPRLLADSARSGACVGIFEHLWRLW